MNKPLAVKVLDAIEEMNVQILALRAMLEAASRNASKEQIDSLLEKTMNVPGVRETVRQQWMPVRKTLESEAGLEAALQQFLKIVPPSKDVN